MIAGEHDDRVRLLDAASAARIAPPVPSASGWTTVSVPSGRLGERSRSGDAITAIRPAPASRAARIGQATIGRPQTGCRTLGCEDRMRVPSPAAMTSTVRPDRSTAES